MKRIVIVLVFFTFHLSPFTSLWAQRTVLSPSAAMMQKQVEEGKCEAASLHAFVTLREGVDRKALDGYGVKVNSVVGDMMTVEIPAKRYDEVVASGLCSYIDLGNEVRPWLDRLRPELGIDYIHQGIGLPQGYDGTGVVVGIIDIGFDYGHPSFRDTTGSVLRIKRVWQQTDSSGAAPAGFSYGTELTTPEQILAAGTDNPRQGHGSHVLGIAAGCGAPDGHGKSYRGVAPAADIVLVATNMQEPSFFDGIRYLHEYARRVGKPLVINMSLGAIEGPHDGHSAHDLMTTNYLEGVDSVVVVVSAANSGGTKNHLHHQFSATDTMMRTFGNTQDGGDGYTFIADCWGAVGDQFSVSVALHDRQANGTYVLVEETPFFSTAADSVYHFHLRSPRDTIYDCAVVVTSANPTNQRPEIMVAVLNPDGFVSADMVALTVKSTASADIHIWSGRQNFSSNGNIWYSDGDDAYTIGGFAGNTDAVVTVGSYATRNTTVLPNGTVQGFAMSGEGNLSEFSSHGPTWDGRVKPDICTPGQFIASVYSSYYRPYYNPMFLFDSTQWNDENYYYCLMAGTSMASPAMAGVVALWMQQTPSLSVDSVRALLHRSARHDRYTGDIPATGSNRWGWGKVDAFAGLPATTPVHYLDATVDGLLHGFVSGRGCHPEGAVTLTAHPFTGYVFSRWSDGNSDNPRIVALVSDTVFEALFETAPCDTVTSYPWNIMFTEALLNCWDNYSAIPGHAPWMPLMGAMLSSTLTGSVDNWLVSQQLVPEAGSTLYYFCNSFTGDSLALVVVTAAGDSVTLTDELVAAGSEEEHHVGLGAYAGQRVRFAFHHHYANGAGGLSLGRARVETMQGIEEIENLKLKIEINGRNLRVENPGGEDVGVYDVVGRQLATSKLSPFTFHLPASGVYILRVGEKSRKVVIR